MSLLNDILKQIQGGIAQVNPFDDGQDYRSVTQPQPRVTGAVNPISQIARGNTVYSPGEGPQTQGFSPQLSPAQRDFPGRTNYGVPEDNMIDTPNGYITAEQYDALQAPRVPQIPQAPNFGPVEGSINPLWQVRRGGIPYTPGEGPQTRF